MKKKEQERRRKKKGRRNKNMYKKSFCGRSSKNCFSTPTHPPLLFLPPCAPAETERDKETTKRERDDKIRKKSSRKEHDEWEGNKKAPHRPVRDLKNGCQNEV